MDEPNQEVQEDGSAPPSKKSRKKPAVEKWGSKVIDSGFSMIPSLLLRAQHRLKLSPTQLAVLVQIIDHWWEASRKPYPSKKELAKRLGIGERQVQRYIAELEAAGLLKREDRFAQNHNGRLSNIYNLDGLVERLKEIEPDFREARDKARQSRVHAETPNLRRRTKAVTPTAEAS